MRALIVLALLAVGPAERPPDGCAYPAAADAAWDAYRHPSGLAYEVYATRTPYGGNQPGDLNRISYGPSDEARLRSAVRRPN